MSTLNLLIASKLQTLKASAALAAATPVVATREEALAGRVVAALKHVGVEEARIKAALDDGTEPNAADLTPLDPANPVTDEEVEAACRLVLAELGAEIEEDDSTGSDGEDDELLDNISELTAQLVKRAGGDTRRLYRATARLTASLNLTVVAAAGDAQ